MPIQTTPSVLLIAPRIPDRSLIHQQFQLSDARITQITTLEEFDYRHSDEHFDMIIVDQAMLLGPTNTTMADLQMLSRQTSSLVITKSDNLTYDACFENSVAEQHNSQSESSGQHLEIISESVRYLSHENRNVLQRIQIRLESLRKTLQDNGMTDEDAKILQLEFKTVHHLLETARAICNSIKLDLELASMSKIIAEATQDLIDGHDSATHIELDIEPAGLLWIDVKEIKTVITKMFQYLMGLTEKSSPIRVVGTVQKVDNQLTYWLSLEAETNPEKKRPNECIDLARAKRIVLLHNGQLDVRSTSHRKSACVLTLPLA